MGLRRASLRSAGRSREKSWVLATAILGSSLAFIEGTAVNLALPSIQTEMAVTSTGIQWVANGYLLVLGSLMLIGGALGDRYGLRRVFMLGSLVFALGAFGCGAATSLPLLIAARLLQGLGGALLVPNSLALVSSHFDEDERGKAIGTWAGASALVTAIGPLVGGWLVDQFGWPAVFLLVGPLAALTAAVAWMRVPPDPAANDEALDYAGGVLLAAALALVVYALADAGAPQTRLLTVGLAVACGAAFLWRETRAAAPMLPLDLFQSRVFSGANLMTLLLYAALSGALYFLPFNLIQVQGYSTFQAGAAFLPFSVIMGFGSALAGGALKTRPPRLILTVGPLLTAAGFLALAVPGTSASYATGFFPGIVLIGVGMTITVAPLTTVVMSAVDDERAGVASGVNNTASRLAGVLALAALTAVAIAYFSGALTDRLEDAGLAPAIVGRIAADAPRLAELTPPPDLAPSTAHSVAGAVASAYVATFRVLMVICGALAAVSAAIAWASLGKDAMRGTRQR